MLKDMTRGEWKTQVWYELAFDDGHGSGFAFPCDADGKVTELPPDAVKNYEFCLAHPERFARYGVVDQIRQRYREPDTGVCFCGERIELHNEYHGACACPNCGRWYNLFGQELRPPEQWEEDIDEEP